MTFISELIRIRKTYVMVSCYSCVQKCSQYVSLKVVCINKEYLILLNIMSFRHAQHNAAVPVIVIFFILSSSICS
jgi:hypothetical protein